MFGAALVVALLFVVGPLQPGAARCNRRRLLPPRCGRVVGGSEGSIAYWNACVAKLELHGIGNFSDARLDNSRRFPVAARAGGFYHDGRFKTLRAVVDHYDNCFHLGLSPLEKSDLVQYVRGL
jgi:hypothetical protein